MQVSSATLNALRVTLGFQFEAAYGATPTWFEKLATVVPSSTRSNIYAWALATMRLREWIGPRVAQNLSEHDYTVVNKKYEGTIEVLREDIEDDNLGIYKQVTLPALAAAAKKHPDQLLAALLTANPVGWDGVALFHDSHPNFNVSGVGATTYDNLYADLDLDGDGVATMYAAMASILGEDGNPLMVTPNLLICAPQLRREAETVANSSVYVVPHGTSVNGSGAVENVMKGWFDVLVVPELAAAPNVWYMADTTKSIKPFLYQDRDAAELVARDNPEDPKVFERDMFTYGVRKRGAMAATLPFLIAKATHTP